MNKITLAVVLAAILTAPAYAQQQGTDHSAHHPAQTQTSAPLADGEVRRVDKDAKTLSLRHGPIPSLDMPPMTMVFRVKDTTMLDKVNVGDKVKFNAEKIPGGYAVTEIQVVK